MVNSPKYNVAIVGCGHIGFWFDFRRESKVGALSHFKAFSDSPDFEIVGLVESDLKNAELVREKTTVQVFSSLNELWNKHNPDVVVLATPDFTHEQYLRELLEFSPKLVFAEKPLTTNPLVEPEIIDSFAKKGIALEVNFTRRFVPTFYEIADGLHQKKWGEAQRVNLYYSRGFLHNAVHFVDLMLWFWGKPESFKVESSCEGLNAGDETISVCFKYPHNLEVRFIGFPTSNTVVFDLDIWFSENRIRVTNNHLVEYFRLIDYPDFTTYKRFESVSKLEFDHRMALPNAVLNIAGWLKGTDVLKSPAENVKEISQLMLNVRQSLGVICE